MDTEKVVYRYGLLAPVANADRVRAVIRAGHNYQNALIAVARECRAERRLIEREVGDLSSAEARVMEAKAELAVALAEVARAKSAGRTRAVLSSMRDRVTAARAAMKEARASFSEMRRRLKEDPSVVEAMARANGRQKEMTAEARRTCGLGRTGDLGGAWGTYCVIEDAAHDAATKPLYDGGEPSDPKFQRWEGEGRVATLVHQKGPDGRGFFVANVLGGSDGAADWLRIERGVSVARTPARTAAVQAARERNAQRRADAITRGGGHTAEMCMLHMRIGSDGRSPVIAQWPMVMHRPLPPGAIITRAVVCLRKIGPREEWSVHLTVTRQMRSTPPTTGGTVAVEIGWAATDDGVRVAHCIDDAGNAFDLTLGTEKGGTMASLRHHEGIRSTRDKNFNAARAELCEWLRARGDVPEWMARLTVRRGDTVPSHAQAIAWLESWRAPARLAALSRRWRENRVDGDDDAYAALETWRYHDFHLWSWERSQQRKAERRRKHEYRVFAARLADTYERLVVSDTTYDKLARRPRTEQSDGRNETAAKNRKNAAPGELREILEQAFKGRGRTRERVPAAGLSSTCPSCGRSDKLGVVERIACCSACQFEGDVDDVAAFNMLRASGLEPAVVGILERRKELGESMRAGKKGANDGRRDDGHEQAAE